MHVLAIVSMLLVVALSMIVRLPDCPGYCICNYRLGQEHSLTISARRQSAPSLRRLQRVGRLRPLVRHGEASSGVGKLFEFVHDRDGGVLRADCIADRAV